MRYIRGLCVIAAALFSILGHGEEVPAYAAPVNTGRKPANYSDSVDPVYEEPAMGGSSAIPHIRNKDGYDGARVLFYYDPMSGYSKFLTNNGASASQFGYATTTGNMGGMQALWSVWAPSDFEFQTGLDYVFPVDVQGQQTTFGSYSVNSQTLTIAGFKVVQVNYRINMADFTLAPYGGIGVYYGKNSVTLNTSFNQTNLINYTKLMMVYTAGARLDYNFNRKRTIAAGIGAEFFVPTKITDQLSQSGSQSSELPGQSNYLEANMDFFTGIGARVYASVAGYF